MIDPNLTKVKQEKVIDDWMNNVFKEYIKKRGACEIVETDVIKNDQFFKLYHLIEGLVKVQLTDERLIS